MEKDHIEIQEVHYLPVADCIEHVASEKCECEPEQPGKNKWDLKEGKTTRVIFVRRTVWCERQ